MDGIRKPFQGVGNIVRFNWHFYLLSVIYLIVLFIINSLTHNRYSSYLIIFSTAITTIIFTSLIVSYYVYDLSNLYTFNWLDNISDNTGKKIVNIHAGFDETSQLLQAKFPNTELTIFDFYDPRKHTEVSIKRARRAYPSFANTQVITTASLPLANNSIDEIYLILAAHEIRDTEERVNFFKELKRVMKNTGKIIVVEHLRNLPNFLAYNIGFFHFHAASTWYHTFTKAGLVVTDTIKITPFIKTFVVTKNGTAY